MKRNRRPGEEPLTGNYTFTVTFSNVGGIGLGSADSVQPMTITIPIGESREITGIPIGTRFQVVETPAADSSLKSVTCTATDAKFDVDNGVRRHGYQRYDTRHRHLYQHGTPIDGY